MGLTSMQRQAQKRLDDARRRIEQKAISGRQQASGGLSDYASEVKERMLGGESYEQATSGAAERREVTGTETIGGAQVPVFGKKAPDPAVLAAQEIARVAQEQAATQKASQRRFLQAQKEARITGLRGARGGSLAALEQRRGRVEPAFLQQRTGLRTQAQQAGRQTEASLAAKGLARSGAQTQSDIARQIALQQGLTESGQQEVEALAGIAAGEAEVERQFETGVAGAESEATAQQAQFALRQIEQQQAQALQTQQLEAARGFETQRTEEARAFQLQLLEREETINEQKRVLDLEVDEARRTQDFEREDQLLRLKSDLDQEEIRLRAQLTPARTTGASGGLTFTQERQVFSDQVKSGLAGINAAISTVPEGGDTTSAILQHLRLLRAQGVPDEVIEQVALQSGISPQRITPTQENITSQFQMPTFGR